MADQPNVDGVLPHETDMRPLEDAFLRGAPREMVLRAAVNMLVQCFSVDVLQAIHQDGYAKFRSVAGEYWRDHGFIEDDYRHAFEVVGIALKDRLMKRGGVTLA